MKHPVATLSAIFILSLHCNGEFVCPIPKSACFRDDVSCRVYHPTVDKSNYFTLKQKAQHGDPEAQWMIGCQLFSGYVADEDSLGTMEIIDIIEAPSVNEKTRKEGLEWLRKAASQDFAPAMQSLCTNLRAHSEKHEALEITNEIIDRASNGDQRFFNFAGIILFFDYKDAGRETEKAQYYFSKAADLGVPFAKFALVRYFEATNLEQSLKYLLDAAKMGLTWAQYDFGDRLLGGAGIVLDKTLMTDRSFHLTHNNFLRDSQRAGVYWVHKSALGGWNKAQLRLAEILTNGVDGILPADYEEALKWSKAAKQMKIPNNFRR